MRDGHGTLVLFVSAFRRTGLVLACLTLLSFGVRAQSQQPPPSPDTKSAQQPPPPTLRVIRQMVQVDIIAKDHNGHPVKDLKQSDFTVYDDGKKQEISWFSLETDKTRYQPSAQLPLDTYSNLVEQKTGVPGNLTILLLDFLNTRHSDIVFARNQVMKLLSEMKPEDRVAVYVLSGRLYVLHDFTSDMPALMRAVKGYDTVDSADLGATSQKTTFDPASNDPAASFFAAQANQNMSDFANIDRAITTTNVFEIISQHMLRVPGRKNLIWVSGSFPFSINTDKMGNSWADAYQKGASPVVPLSSYLQSVKQPGPGTGPAGTGSEGLFIYQSRTFKDELDRAVRELAGANIALYPVDPRGLIGAFGTDPNYNAASPLGPATYQAQFSLEDFAPNIDTMRDLAERTGGLAYYNTNDIGGSVRSAIEDSRVSYMVAYYPSEDDGKGKFHNIKVKLNRSGIDLRYRTGYYARPLNFTGTVDNTAIIRQELGSPLDATGLGITVHAKAMDTPGKRTLGMTITVEEKDVSWKVDGDRTIGNIQVTLAQFDAEGNETIGETSTVKMRLDKDVYSKSRKDGLQFGRSLPLLPNTVMVKVVTCDEKSSAIGSVSIPVARYFPPATH